jgi:hypothetical protein
VLLPAAVAFLEHAEADGDADAAGTVALALREPLLAYMVSGPSAAQGKPRCVQITRQGTAGECVSSEGQKKLLQ